MRLHQNVLWLSDFTYRATWQCFVYVAFVTDISARRIVGGRVSRIASAGFVPNAMEQAIHRRRPDQDKLVHHADRGSQYLAVKCTERLAEATIAPSVGSVGDSYDNAPAETINGLFKAGVIQRRGPWRNFEAVAYATLEWVDWFNNQRLLEPSGNIPPAEAEANFYADLQRSDMAAQLRQISLRQTRRGSSGRKRRADLPRHHRQREVPRQDSCNYTHRFAHDQRQRIGRRWRDLIL
jgi:transposase InsO family protein